MAKKADRPERAPARERQREALERAWRRKQTGRKGQPASDSAKRWSVHGGESRPAGKAASPRATARSAGACKAKKADRPERAARERQREALERAWRKKQTGRKGRQPASDSAKRWSVHGEESRPAGKGSPRATARSAGACMAEKADRPEKPPARERQREALERARRRKQIGRKGQPASDSAKRWSVHGEERRPAGKGNPRSAEACKAEKAERPERAARERQREALSKWPVTFR